MESQSFHDADNRKNNKNPSEDTLADEVEILIESTPFDLSDAIEEKSNDAKYPH